MWSAPDAFRHFALTLSFIIAGLYAHDLSFSATWSTSAAHFHKTCREFQKREPTGGSTKHPGKVVFIENFLTCNNQICNAHDEIQYVSKSCLHIYNIRWLQLVTVLWELDYPQLTVYVSWIEHTMLNAGGASWGNVFCPLVLWPLECVGCI